MKTQLLVGLLLMAVYAQGQRVPNKYKKYFVNCCDAKPTAIRSLIDIDGYFKMSSTMKSNPKDTNYSTILFYEDGICVSGWGGYESEKEKFLTHVISSGEKDYFYINCAWGFYGIHGDTIVVRSIVPGTFMRPVSVWETSYKAINKTTIQIVDSRTLEKMSEKEKVYYENVWSDFINLPSMFYPLQNIPPSKYSWLRKQKCITCK